jgi:hypothetical protein
VCEYFQNLPFAIIQILTAYRRPWDTCQVGPRRISLGDLVSGEKVDLFFGSYQECSFHSIFNLLSENPDLAL